MSETHYKTVEESAMAMFATLQKWQEFDRGELMNYAGEEAHNLMRRNPEEVEVIYRRMQERARRMSLIQTILRKEKY